MTGIAVHAASATRLARVSATSRTCSTKNDTRRRSSPALTKGNGAAAASSNYPRRNDNEGSVLTPEEERLAAMLEVERRHLSEKETATEEGASFPPCVEWRSAICEWYYRVADQYGYDREVVAIALNLFDRYLVELRERRRRMAEAAAAGSTREQEESVADDCSRSVRNNKAWYSHSTSYSSEEISILEDEGEECTMPLSSSSEEEKEDYYSDYSRDNDELQEGFVSNHESQLQAGRSSDCWSCCHHQGGEELQENNPNSNKNARPGSGGSNFRYRIATPQDWHGESSPSSSRQSPNTAACPRRRRQARNHRVKSFPQGCANGQEGEENQRAVSFHRPVVDIDEGEEVEEDCTAAADIDPHTYQLMATTCLYLSCKMWGAPLALLRKEETYDSKERKVFGPRLKISTFTFLSQGRFTSEDIAQAELDVLCTLRWRVQSPTAVEFAGRTLRGMLFPLLIAHKEDSASRDADSASKLTRRSSPSFPLLPHEVNARRRRSRACSASSPRREVGSRHAQKQIERRWQRSLLVLHVLNEISRYLIELSLCVPEITCGVEPSLLALAAIDVSCDLLNEKTLPPEVMDIFSSRAASLFGRRAGEEEGSLRRQRREVLLLRRLKESMRSKFLTDMLDAASFSSPSSSSDVDAASATDAMIDVTGGDGAPENGVGGNGDDSDGDGANFRHRNPLAIARDARMLRPDMLLALSCPTSK